MFLAMRHHSEEKRTDLAQDLHRNADLAKGSYVSEGIILGTMRRAANEGKYSVEFPTDKITDIDLLASSMHDLESHGFRVTFANNTMKIAW